jgi:hypothetical protein
MGGAVMTIGPPAKAGGRISRRDHPFANGDGRDEKKERTIQLTETPFILECPVQADDARMARAKADEGVFLYEGGIQLVVTLEVTLVEHFDRVFLPRRTMLPFPHNHDCVFIQT